MCNAFFPTDYNTAATVLASFGISLGTMIMNPLSGKLKPQIIFFQQNITWSQWPNLNWLNTNLRLILVKLISTEIIIIIFIFILISLFD